MQEEAGQTGGGAYLASGTLLKNQQVLTDGAGTQTGQN